MCILSASSVMSLCHCSSLNTDYTVSSSQNLITQAAFTITSHLIFSHFKLPRPFNLPVILFLKGILLKGAKTAQKDTKPYTDPTE